MNKNEVITLVKLYQLLNLSDILHHDKFLHYALTFHSTAIEGSTLTEMETAFYSMKASLLVENHWSIA